MINNHMNILYQYIINIMILIKMALLLIALTHEMDCPITYYTEE
jgi:hypothetical protein